MRLITDNKKETPTFEGDEVFSDPVAYLASFGIQAELISPATELPEAA